MKIIKGRGNRREVYEVPHGSVFATEEKKNPQEYNRVMVMIHDIVGI